VTTPFARASALGAAILAALGAACSGGHQVVIELAGVAPGAERLEVVLLEPVVLAKEQRHNMPLQNDADPTLETVFYMAERSRTRLELGGAGLDGFQLELRDTGGPFVPLVGVLGGAAGTAEERLLALGVYDPASIAVAPLGREHTPSTVSPVGDVTIFPIQLEPVTAVLAPAPASGAPPVVRPGEILPVACAGTGAPSGLVWRRADDTELRVLLPLGDASGAARLDPPDLDCDRHSPGKAGVVRTNAGDQRDCDDTAAFVHAGVREQCTKLDEDCNPLTTLSPATCPQACPSMGLPCVCDEAGGTESCLQPVTAGECKVPSTSSSVGRQPCDAVGLIKLGPCAGGCEVLLAWAPPGLEVSISDVDGADGVGLGKWAPLADATAYLSVHASRAFTEPILYVIARIKAGGAITNVGIPLQPAELACGAPTTFSCPIL
jgi:hypothetical protein